MKALSDVGSEQMQGEKLYVLEPKRRELLIESAPLLVKWARTECRPKEVGGMEEWSKEHNHQKGEVATECGWYHSTWQLLRLLNMVAVPPWYPFYQQALTSVLRKRPYANVLISAAADYGMVATLHEAVVAAEATPKITIYDICNTPLLATHWYAERNGFQIESVCDNIIYSQNMPLGTFDLIVTDEFLTVLKSEYKPLIAKRWRELLAPGGSLVTTAMIGGETTPELRKGYAERARRLLKENADAFENVGLTEKELHERFDYFAAVHTRHMLTDEAEIRTLLSDYQISYLSPVVTPGECVNPTTSYQIVASVPYVPNAE